MQSVNEPGTLAQVAQVIAEHDGNIDNIRMERQSPDFTSLTIDLEVYDLKHLDRDHRPAARQAGGRESRAGNGVGFAVARLRCGSEPQFLCIVDAFPPQVPRGITRLLGSRRFKGPAGNAGKWVPTTT